ncbi:unnamed protein product [Musa banksii]
MSTASTTPPPHKAEPLRPQQSLQHIDSMASLHLLPNSLAPVTPSFPPPTLRHSSVSTFVSSPPAPHPRRLAFSACAKRKKNPWLDPFDDGEDPDMEYGSLFADGKQEEDPRPPEDPDNPYGFLKFPMGFNVELDSLAAKVRGDVRRCCCVVSGGVYENLLFFPVVQLIKDRYPGVLVDVVASPRGKQTYELNKNVRWANAYDPDEDFPESAEYIDMIGVLKNRYYDMILSTKLSGLGHAAFLFMTSARDKVSYVYPNVNAAGAGLLLTETFTPPSSNLSQAGFDMYHQMVEWLGRPARNVPRQPVPPLKVSISKKLKAYVEAKYSKAGAEKRKFVVIHGIETDSVASMRSKGDTDCLLPIRVWAEIAKGIRGVKPLFVIPHEKVREDVEEVIGEDSCILFITTPGQLAALIDDSAGVIATNTAAIQLATARNKPSIALFSSEEKGNLFIPNAQEKRCSIVSSPTGKLKDIDVEAVKNAVEIFEGSPVFA